MGSPSIRRWWYWPILVVGLGIGLWGILFAIFWAQDHVPAWVWWKAGLCGLIAMEAAYAVTVVATLVAIPVLVVVARRRRREGRSIVWPARGLLLSHSLLIGLGLAEALAGVWQARAAARASSARGDAKAPAAGVTNLFRIGDVELPTEFPETKDDGTIDLVVLGESSAAGVPFHDWFSIGPALAWQLGELVPSCRFRAEVLAASGETFELQHERLAGLRRRPDVILVYGGHNEFSGRFQREREVRHYLDGPPPSPFEVVGQQIEATSSLCALIRQGADKCRVAIPPPDDGRRSLVDVPAFTPEEFEALVADFRRRLESVVAYAEAVGALPVLIIPAGNDGGFEPNRSYLPAEMPYADRRAFARDFERNRRLEASDPSRAIEGDRNLIGRAPGFAEAHYRLARLLDAAGESEEAYRHDVLARDLDGYPMRCPTRFQNVFREVAARHPCLLIDAQSYFHAIGRRGLLADDLFHDLMHPSLRGQIALAQAVLRGLKERRAFDWPADVADPVLDPRRFAEHFGIGSKEWMTVCNNGAVVCAHLAPLRFDRAQREAGRDAFQRALARIKAGEPPEAVGQPNIGIPGPVPVIPGAFVWTGNN